MGKVDCDICGKTFSRNFTLKRHYRDVHSVQPEVANVRGGGSGKANNLEEDNLDQTSLDEMDEISNDFETGSPAVELEIKVEVVEESSPPSEMDNVLPTPTPASEPKPRRYIINPATGKPQCLLCSMTFSSKESFHDHYRSLHLHKRFRCEICDKEFRQKASLWRHNQGVHKGVRFQCPKCSKLFPEKSHLRSHQRTSISCGTDERHPCHICGKEYTRDRTLQEHLSSVHSNSKEHLCSQCGKGFSAESRLQRHVEAVHLKLKEHLCDLCGKGFNRKCHLVTHRLMVHQGKKSKSKKLKSSD